MARTPEIEPSKALQPMGGASTDPGKALLKGLISGIPVIGGVVSEIIGQMIPDQRIDRLESYVTHLGEELSRIGATDAHEKIKEPENVDLFEDGAFASARAMSDERRLRIARLVAFGVSGDELARLEAKRLLALLAQLDDGQVIILCSYLSKNKRNPEFWDAHESVLQSGRVHLRSSRGEHDTALVRELGREQLLRLGLLRENFRRPERGKSPEFDEKTGRMKVVSRSVSPLGRLLLRRLGLAEEGDA
jgi:hypothetical protein